MVDKVDEANTDFGFNDKKDPESDGNEDDDDCDTDEREQDGRENEIREEVEGRKVSSTRTAGRTLCF